MLSDFSLAASWSFKISDQILNFLFFQFRPGAKFYSPGNCLDAALSRSLLNQLPFELANRGKSRETEKFVH